MPIIKSAIKKVRKDQARTKHNLGRKSSVKQLLKSFRRQSDQKTLSQAFSALDKAAKVKLIHPNKASRLKSRLAKTLPSK